MRFRLARVTLIAWAVCLLAVGCAPPKTTVTGKVTFRGQPIRWGSITLVGADGIAHPGALQADGSFSIPGVPVGAVKIAVRSENPSPPGAGRGGPGDPGARKAATRAPVFKPATEWFPIPERYADPGQSGLTAEVQSGQPLHVDLQ